MQTNHLNFEPDGGLFYTVPEAAQLLRVSYWTVNRLIQRGELTCVKIGAQRRIPRAAITQLTDTSHEHGDSQRGYRHV
jgi:excisionase family DNA binding protein